MENSLSPSSKFAAKKGRLRLSLSLRLLGAAGAFIAASTEPSLSASEDPPAMKSIDVTHGKEMMLNYFAREVARIEEAWQEEAESYDTGAQDRDRQRFAEMLGLWPMPPKTDLNATVTGEVRREGVLVRKVYFQSMPGLYVTANLYLPEDAAGPLPAVLYLPGHTLRVKEGTSYGPKVADHYQTHPIWYARNGIASLIIDTLNGGEIQGAHHGTYNLDRWWWVNRGYTPSGVEAWNAVRALDYLESLPEIDSARLAVTGLSGGGGTSWWVNALDARPVAIAPTAGITDLHGYLADHRIENHCDCMFPVNHFRWSLGKVASLGVPRPVLLAQNDQDHLFPIDGVRRLANQAAGIYQRFGRRENFETLVRSGGHSDPPLRPGTYRWIYRHLKGEEPRDEILAPARPLFSMEELQVFTGTLPADERNTRIDEELIPAAELPAPPASAEEWVALREGWMQELRDRVFFGWPSASAAPVLHSTDKKNLGSLTLQAFDFETQEGIRLRLWTLGNERSASMLDLQVMDASRWSDWLAILRAAMTDAEAAEVIGPGAFSTPWPAADAAALQEVTEEVTLGNSLLAFFAPRGVGPTHWLMPGEPRDSIRRAFLPLGQTLEGMQVWDVMQAVAAIRAVPQNSALPVNLISHEAMAGVALYASIFQPTQKLSLHRLPPSHHHGPFLLNIRRILDLPQALAMAAEHIPVELHETAPASSAWARATLRSSGLTGNVSHRPASGSTTWKAGTARRKITPGEPMWMTGFGVRNRPASETLQDIWIKALALQDPDNQTALILSADLCGLPASVIERVCSQLHEQFGLPREAVMINVTHTHCGPSVAGYLEGLSARVHMTPEDFATEERYTRHLEVWLAEAAAEALQALQPAKLSWGSAEAHFAVNRRENRADEAEERRASGTLEGPSDPEVPVLAVSSPDGKVTALLASYACHATVLSSYEWSGDWPGFAQEELEKAFPGATALFVAGCGGDQNAYPRRTVEYAREYGAALSEAVQAVVRGGLKPVKGNLDLRFDTVELAFERVPSREELEEDLRHETPARRLRAEVLLRRLERDGGISPTYAYPIQVWNLGPDLTWVSLAGEVVVDYALRLKRELGPGRTWITAYAHDIVGYVPSKRVWEEGGYEGDTSHVFYALPSRWTRDVEETIVQKVHQIVGTTSDSVPFSNTVPTD